jgi:hypothetical protein
MALMYEVNAYDRQTGRLAVSYNVPERKIAFGKKIAEIPVSEDGLGSYPLNPDQIAEIARTLKAEIAHGNYNFFLEPYEEPQQRLKVARSSPKSVE